VESWKLVALAISIEAVLVVAAAFGGPHGELGGWPWALQLPGILLVFYPPGGNYFLVRVGVMALVQALIWYAVLKAARHALSARTS
jgi:hypothetical protein